MEGVWFAKLDDGRVYGPVNVAKLAAWAREGRLDPTSLISRDRVNWSPAPQKTALGMNWIVETAIGTWFGPFHHDVVEELYKANQVPAGARLYRLTPRQTAMAELTPAADDGLGLEKARKELATEKEAHARIAQEKDALAQEKEALVREKEALAQEKGRLVRENEKLVRENEKLVKENEKLSKAKRGKGLGGLLFGGGHEVDFAQIELAAQRELAAAKQRSEARGAGFSPRDVIDIA